MITIEPIMLFSLGELVAIVKMADPEQVNIGADSKGHGLLEPCGHDVGRLIDELSKFTKVYSKPNLARILRQ